MAHPLDFLTPKPQKWHDWKTALGTFPILLRFPDDAEVKAALSRYLKPDRVTGGSLDMAEQARWVASLVLGWKIEGPDGSAVPWSAEDALYLVQQNRDLRGWIESTAMSADAFRGEVNGAVALSATGTPSRKLRGSRPDQNEAAPTAPVA